MATAKILPAKALQTETIQTKKLPETALKTSINNFNNSHQPPLPHIICIIGPENGSAATIFLDEVRMVFPKAVLVGQKTAADMLYNRNSSHSIARKWRHLGFANKGLQI